MLHTLSDIKSHVSADLFEKAMELVRGGHVVAPNVQQGGELITAVITNTGAQPCRVYIRLNGTDNHNTIHGECS